MDEAMKAKVAALKASKLAETKANAAADSPELAAAQGDGAVSLPHPTPPAAPTREALNITAGTSRPAVKSVEELDADPLAKLRIFRSRIPGSSFVMREGYTIYFTHGWYETSDPSEIDQLDKVANKVPTIHTDEHETEIVDAILAARREGFQGSIGEAMAQQLTAEQRLNALRQAGKAGNVPVLTLPSVLPADGGLGASTTTAADAAKMDVSLQNAIRSAAAQSNS